MRHRLSVLVPLLLATTAGAQQAPPKPAFAFEEVMIPMRDGAHLQTAILTRTDRTGPLPILFRGTPYGVPPGPHPGGRPTFGAIRLTLGSRRA
jgi:predicted acyl esterase